MKKFKCKRDLLSGHRSCLRVSIMDPLLDSLGENRHMSGVVGKHVEFLIISLQKQQ